MLRILSLYLAPDGEANHWHQGTWSLFVRTSGCTVGCRWCDTRYSWSSKRGRDFTVSELVENIEFYAGSIQRITLTGGEPLEQPLEELAQLFDLLLKKDFTISVETSGAAPVHWLKERSPDLALVVDWKPPSAKASPMILDNYLHLAPRHVIKLGVADGKDFSAAVELVRSIRNDTRARMVVSPIMPVKGWKEPGLQPSVLLNWMRNSPMLDWNVGLNLQLHKFIHGDSPRDEELTGADWSNQLAEAPRATADHI